jgi:hypothetical protein
MARARAHRLGGFGAWGAALAVAAVLTAFAGVARAEDVVVVGNPALPVDSVSTRDLKRIYVGEKTFVGGVKVEPLDYTHAGPVAEAFLRAVVGMDATRFHAWWVKEVFHGGGIPPRRVEDPAEVLRLVASEPGAIGYVPAGSLAGNPPVKRLLSLPILP